MTQRAALAKLSWPTRHWLNPIVLLIAVITILSIVVTIDVMSQNGILFGPARAGQDVALSGGRMRVNAVLPEMMAQMNHQQFANLGMTMSAMVPDSTPEGMRTFTVVVTLFGEGSGLTYNLEEFVVSGQGMLPVAAMRTDMGSNIVPAGSLMQGTLIFRVPKDATNLTLRYGNSRPIALELDLGYGHDTTHEGNAR